MIQKCEEIVIIDFETTGLSPEYDRIIEVGAVIVKNNKIIASFDQLMNPGFSIPNFITNLTGISSEMVRSMPSPENVMPRLKKFIGDRTILAHNASFDKRFLLSEMDRVGIKIQNRILCTLLLSRRLILNSASYKLSELAKILNFPTGRAHRALDDVKVTAMLWDHLHSIVSRSTGITNPDLDFFEKISKTPKKSVGKFLESVG